MTILFLLHFDLFGGWSDFSQSQKGQSLICARRSTHCIYTTKCCYWGTLQAKKWVGDGSLIGRYGYKSSWRSWKWNDMKHVPWLYTNFMRQWKSSYSAVNEFESSSNPFTGLSKAVQRIYGTFEWIISALKWFQMSFGNKTYFWKVFFKTKFKKPLLISFAFHH